MGSGRRPRILPASVLTVGAMLEAGTRVRLFCTRCDGAFNAPLELIARGMGEGFSLVGVFPRCPVWDCGGRCLVHTSPGGGTPFRPLSPWPPDLPR